jgi:hypothetical protein
MHWSREPIDCAGLPRTDGYIKRTSGSTYRTSSIGSSARLSLRNGRRCPQSGRATQALWYVRLPGGSSTPWSGVVRCECSGALKRDDDSRLTDTVTIVLQRLASRPHKDPRAPKPVYRRRLERLDEDCGSGADGSKDPLARHSIWPSNHGDQLCEWPSQRLLILSVAGVGFEPT